MTKNMEMHSPSEIAFYLTRAAVGVGVPFGIAEDFANSLIWSQRTGIDLAQLALHSLEALELKPGSGRISMYQRDLTKVFTGETGLSAIFAGPTLSDFWRISSKKNLTLIAKEVYCPILVAGAFVGAKARPAILKWPDVCITLSVNGDTDLIVTDEMALKKPGSFDILIRKPEKEESTKKSSHISTDDLNKMALKAINQGIYINKEAWTGIVNRFNRSLVPSSNQSLNTGAGAGLVDTD